MAIKVITPNGLDYFKELQDQYNKLAFALYEHTHTPQSLGAAELLHEHEMADVNGLYDALNNKSSVGHKHVAADIEDWQASLNDKADRDHTHTIANITGLQGELNAKADVNHTHTVENITDLSDKLHDIDVSLNGKADSTHTHTSVQITDLNTLLSDKADSAHTHTTSDVTGLDTSLSTINSELSSVKGDISSAEEQLHFTYSLKGGSALSEDADLNEVRGLGNYVCDSDSIAMTIQNSPAGYESFSLRVGDLLGDGVFLYQEVTRHTDGASWRRTLNTTSNTWSAWSLTSFAPVKRMLWSGIWDSGSITIDSIQNYNAFVFYSETGGMLIGFKSYNGSSINCYGVICADNNVMTVESATISVVGTTLTRVMPRTWTFTGTTISKANLPLVFTRIEGLF